MTIETTPFELDIAEQPDALRRLAAAGAPDGLRALAGRSWERIVLTGMGSSHFAGLPTWRALVAAGRPAWWVDAGQLLDTPELLTPGTLLVATSQSGASGEVVELLGRVRGTGVTVVGVADDESSPLATGVDLRLPLHSGPEATVSTKSYLNTLGVHRHIAAAFTGVDAGTVSAEIASVADFVARSIADIDVAGLAARITTAPDRRIAAVGNRDQAATALLVGLIVKESAKVAIEGFIGGQFRHGPAELAGPGLSVLLFGSYADQPDPSLTALSRDLEAAGSTVVLVGDAQPGGVWADGAAAVAAPGAGGLERLATATVAAELFAVQIARANGVVPGAFAFGSKVTTAL
ncbi:SIS domain-containing protein [Tsukamurella soli]|uniref:SIS domain-containing protein n=1 Tax=Tsukamurella soli TaxID=644556 RepID=UPI0036231E16